MPKVFISYSHQDEEWKDRLEPHLGALQQANLLSVWDDRQIAMGEDWYPEIEAVLNSADIAILLISAHFLNSAFILGKEIPPLLKRRKQDGMRVIPLILKPCPWRKIDWLAKMQGASRDNAALSGMSEHDADLTLSDLAEGVLDGFEASLSLPPVSTPKFHTDRLPTVKGDLFGRKAELQMLDDAWRGDDTRIIQFIAPGGTGKTKLLHHWIDRTGGIDALLAWSFYSQGAGEDKQISATPFFSHALEKLGSQRTKFATDEDKGEHLAELLRAQRCLLVLDGLEPLQHIGKGMQGELKDRTLRALLKGLVGAQWQGLCLITSRITVHELEGRSHVINHNLHNLTLDDGVQLLRSFRITGSEAELKNAVQEYGHHALALHLLGNAVHTYLDGDIRRRDTLDELIDDYDPKGRHAFKVMQAYAEWMQGTAELKLLSLLGLFDHPIEREVLQVLWRAAIPHLTEGVDEKAWRVAQRDLLEKHHLLSEHEDQPELFDCHPLIREYFGRQLRAQEPEAWRQAHELLYDYYRGLPEKEQPDTLVEMAPLFNAVAHGCAAGLHQRVLEEVYWPRIRREQEAYIVKKLGAFSDDLATVAHFFATPWSLPVAGLGEMWRQARVLNWAGFSLRALRRLREAEKPIRVGMEADTLRGDWKNAASAASTLSELQLTLGNLTHATDSAHRSVDYAERSGGLFLRMGSHTTLADALQQRAQHPAEIEAARKHFSEAEQLQQERQPDYPHLYSLQGFKYCDLLLREGEIAAVLQRAEQSIKMAERNNWLLGTALDQLTLGQAYLQQAVTDSPAASADSTFSAQDSFRRAGEWLEKAVAGLREAGYQYYLPLSLLSRAAWFRYVGNLPAAHRDLNETFELAEGCGMRLHLTDAHLEAARLALTEGEKEMAENHTAAAEKLIEGTGYNRRLSELAALQR